MRFLTRVFEVWPLQFCTHVLWDIAKHYIYIFLLQCLLSGVPQDHIYPGTRGTPDIRKYFKTFKESFATPHCTQVQDFQDLTPKTRARNRGGISVGVGHPEPACRPLSFNPVHAKFCLLSEQLCRLALSVCYPMVTVYLLLAEHNHLRWQRTVCCVISVPDYVHFVPQFKAICLSHTFPAVDIWSIDDIY